MPEILLVNPRKRKTARRKTTVKKRRTAKQKAATRKLVAFNKRRKNPVKRKRRATRKKPAAPKRRRASARRAPVRRRRRRNPSMRLTARSIGNQVMDAGTGAVGALGLDVIQGYLPIPAQWKGGIIGTGVKALLAIGMGIVVSNVKIIRSATANKMVNGALVVVLHDELRKQVSTFAPGLQLGEYLDDNGLGYAGSGLTAGWMGEDNNGMGIYLPEIQDMSMGMEQEGLGMYESGEEYIDDLTYT